jgi:hypothetical protein
MAVKLPEMQLKAEETNREKIMKMGNNLRKPVNDK